MRGFNVFNPFAVAGGRLRPQPRNGGIPQARPNVQEAQPNAAIDGALLFVSYTLRFIKWLLRSWIFKGKLNWAKKSRYRDPAKWHSLPVIINNIMTTCYEFIDFCSHVTDVINIALEPINDWWLLWQLKMTDIFSTSFWRSRLFGPRIVEKTCSRIHRFFLSIHDKVGNCVVNGGLFWCPVSFKKTDKMFLWRLFTTLKLRLRGCSDHTDISILPLTYF